MGQENIFIDAVLHFEETFRGFDFNRFWDLRGLMAAFPHIRIREGFALDGYYSGDRRNAVMKLYASGLDSTDRYYPVPEELMDRLTERPRFVWIRQQDRESSVEHIDEPKPKVPEITPFREGQFIEDTIPRKAAETVPDLENYLELDFLPIAIWEAVILLRASRLYLPHRWHGCYNNGLLVVNEKSLRTACESVNSLDARSARGCYIPSSGSRESLKLPDELYDNLRLAPEVKLVSKEEAIVRYCYWNNWIGLTQVTVGVVRNNAGILLIESDICKEVIFEYHSVIRY